MCKFEPARCSPRLLSATSRLPVSPRLSPKKYGRVIKSAYISINKWQARKFHPPTSEKNRERTRKGYPLVDNIALVLVDVDVVILFFFSGPPPPHSLTPLHLILFLLPHNAVLLSFFCVFVLPPSNIRLPLNPIFFLQFFLYFIGTSTQFHTLGTVHRDFDELLERICRLWSSAWSEIWKSTRKQKTKSMKGYRGGFRSGTREILFPKWRKFWEKSQLLLDLWIKKQKPSKKSKLFLIFEFPSQNGPLHLLLRKSNHCFDFQRYRVENFEVQNFTYKTREYEGRSKSYNINDLKMYIF